MKIRVYVVNSGEEKYAVASKSLYGINEVVVEPVPGGELWKRAKENLYLRELPFFPNLNGEHVRVSVSGGNIRRPCVGENLETKTGIIGKIETIVEFSIESVL